MSHATTPAAPVDQSAVDWLLAGDPAIRWQALRDLAGAPAAEWQAERRRTAESGWGAALLARQDADGGWGGGIYSPKWTSTTYTLLTLIDIGIPPDTPAARRGTLLMLDAQLGPPGGPALEQRIADCDRCVVGMMLRIAATYAPDDPRADALAANLLAERMPDGAWNCRRLRKPRPTHSSFHTTLNVLEGLRAYLDARDTPLCAELRAAEREALELLLAHRLFRSDKTGAVIRPEFTQVVYPHRWHYDVLRALAYFARAGAPADPRLQDAIDLLHARRHADGRWSAGKPYSGKVFFHMEGAGPSRWNTLRALRVLRWWSSQL